MGGAGMLATEQRASERVRTLMLGTLAFQNRTVVCVIADFSPTGARLRVNPDVPLPETFDLYMPQTWMTYRVELRWRRDGEIGVEFATQPPSTERELPR